MPTSAIHPGARFVCRCWSRAAALALVALLVAAPFVVAAAEPKPLELEDAPQPLDPLQPATQADRDRVEALALFAAARTEEGRENYGGALRLYQRALRHDPNSLAILERIIELAQQLERDEEAARYAAKALELDSSDPRRVLATVMSLTERRQYRPALDLCRQFRAGVKGQPPKKDIFYLLFSLQTVQLAFLEEAYDEAADAVRDVLVALDDPGKFGIDPARRRELLANEARQYELFGEVFLKAERPDDAQRMFDRVQKVAANDAVQAFHKAQVARLRKQPEEALKQLDIYFAAHEVSQDWSPYQLLEKVLKEANRADELLPKVEKIWADDPGNVPLRYFLAEQYRAAGQWKKAEPHYRDLLKQSPKLDAYQGMLEVASHEANGPALLGVLANVMEKLDDLEPVEDEVAELAKNPKLVDALVAAARARRKERQGALDYASAAAVAHVVLQAERFDVAREFFNEAIAAKPSEMGELIIAWGQGLSDADRFPEAIAVLERGLKENALPPDSPLLHTYLSTVLAMDKQFDRALEVAEEAVKRGEGSVFLESRIPWILYFAQRYDESVAAYRRLIEEFDDDYKDPQARQVLRDARLTLSNIAVIRKDNAAAEEWLEQVLDEFPEDAGALNDLGYLWADQNKNLPRALAMIQQAVAEEPDNPAYRDSLGWALYRLRRFPEAIVELRKATADEDADGVILEHLGDAEFAAGHPTEAEAAWRRALKALADEDDSAEKIAEIERKLQQLAAGAKKPTTPKPPPPKSTTKPSSTNKP